MLFLIKSLQAQLCPNVRKQCEARTIHIRVWCSVLHALLRAHNQRLLARPRQQSIEDGSFFLQRQCCSSSQCEQAQRVEFVCAARCASRLTPHASRDVVLTTRFTIWIRSNAKQKCSTALRCSQCSQSRSSRSSRDTTEFESMAVLKTRSIFEAQPYRLRRNQIASTRTVLS